VTTQPSLEGLVQAIRELRSAALLQEDELGSELSRVHSKHAEGARNLAHYLAVRQHDVRELQRTLAGLGLSSLGRMERHVVATLNAVEHALLCLGENHGPRSFPDAPTDFHSGERGLVDNASALLGPAPASGRSRMMVTLPADTTVDLIDELLRAGAGIFRINCAKGQREDWGRLIERIRGAERRHGEHCRVLCDLAGPNPRTVALVSPSDGEVIARVSRGDRLVLLQRRDAFPDAPGPVVGCTLPSIIDDLHPGERVYYDDGKAAAVVRELRPGAAVIEITSTMKPGVKIRPGKGLNFPDSKLALPSLTDKDLGDLEFVAEHADVVGLSFVRRVEDVERLRDELRRIQGDRLGIVVKIETLEGFAELPRLLLSAMQEERVGVMVARGDMALELGYARLAEAQEEILWVCEAALVPVIWATQVLESLNKRGVPSRAEVTDAAMSGRAECVMLNQGAHVVEAVGFLAGVLDRMQDHQEKKSSLLRRLSISNVARHRSPSSSGAPPSS
jgi:pyruvate kinase